MPTDKDVQSLLDRAAELTGEQPVDNGNDSEVLPGWDEVWQQFDQLVANAPYLTE